uniref:Uncharacterized protein n=1 Tax=Picea glauca TaxID=3330 RepID=A0A101LYY1_PICGL|nr:hypothetical protein ABT39_MTgene4767 [Picea glauca]
MDLAITDPVYHNGLCHYLPLPPAITFPSPLPLPLTLPSALALYFK